MSAYDERTALPRSHRGCFHRPRRPGCRRHKSCRVPAGSSTTIVERAEADTAFREGVVADLETALRAEGIEPTRPLLEELRRRVSE